MKTSHLTPTVWLGIAALATSVWAQPPTGNPPGRRGGGGGGAPAGAPATLVFNFRGAPLEQVLTYMSEEAGFIIVTETAIRGTVDAFSAQPITREEALQLLNFALNKNGYTSLVQGRTIVITSKDEAKKKNLPIRTGNNADEIPNTAEMYIQIIPLRRLDATTAARDLGSLLPGSSTITPNADSNSLLVTDTNINLKQVVTLVNALDTSTDTISTTKIFTLKNADPVEMAQLLGSLYSSATNTQNGANGRGGAAAQFGGAGGLAGLAGLAGFGGGNAFGGGGGGRGGAGGAAGGGRGGRGGGATTNRNVPVVAVAYPANFKVIVTASKEQMPDISELVEQLDEASGRKQQAFIYTLENANPKQVETILKQLVTSSRGTQTTTTQDDALTNRATTNARQNTTQNLQLGTGTTTGTTGR